MKREKMQVSKLINWRGLSNIIVGDNSTIRSGRKPRKFKKQIEALEAHIKAWADENKIESMR